MTAYQIGAVALLVAIAAWTYWPAWSLRIPALPQKRNTLKQIEQVLAIKESSPSPKVQEACQQLLQVLIS